jgi:hypothetical protein
MRNCDVLCVCLTAALLAAAARPAAAQTFENAGVRAQGMAGAFVAVSDDASATWWNPAGLASGAYLSSILERGQVTEPRDPQPQVPGRETVMGDFAVAFPSLGLSVYRLRIHQIDGPASTADVGDNRQDPAIGGSSVRSVAVNQYGVTVGQSIGRHLVLGTTLKILHAGQALATTAGGEPLDDADNLDVSRHWGADLDVGAMATLGRLKVGMALKNLTEPDFGDGIERMTLQRQARVGMALLSVPNGALQGFTVAGDADLTTTSTIFGDVRHIAGGVEGWMANGRVGLRGGVAGNTVGESRLSGSVGGSVKLTRAFHVDVSRTVGRDESVSGWSTSLSVAF